MPPHLDKRFRFKILQLDDDDNVINEYKSIGEAARKMGCTKTAISNCILGKTKTSFKYKWKRCNI